MQKVAKLFVLLFGSIKLICTVCWFVIGCIDMFPGDTQLITAFVSKAMVVNMVLTSGIEIEIIRLLLIALPAGLLLISLLVIVFVKNRDFRNAVSIYMIFLALVDFICSAIMAFLYIELFQLFMHNFIYILSLIIDIVFVAFVILFFNREQKTFFRRNQKSEDK